MKVVRPGMIDTDIQASGGQPDRDSWRGPSPPLRRAGVGREVAAMWSLSQEASCCADSTLDGASRW